MARTLYAWSCAPWTARVGATLAGAREATHAAACFARPRDARRTLRSTMCMNVPDSFSEKPLTAKDDIERQEAEQRLDDLVDWPCMYTFKVIGLRQGDFIGDISDSIAQVLEVDASVLKVSHRDKGRYRSLTVNAPCNSAEQVYSIYAAIDRDPRRVSSGTESMFATLSSPRLSPPLSSRAPAVRFSRELEEVNTIKSPKTRANPETRSPRSRGQPTDFSKTEKGNIMRIKSDRAVETRKQVEDANVAWLKSVIDLDAEHVQVLRK
ncbi:UPF0250 protein [Porphyridium purpureum]|uniref:UPF0250 protein n=1 Tax=Porphyridium purpureum TaxID=35688 RepID=A0A5J4YP83_PORPP|nr:UPF0250 protein [Porphyridium purpureum]|eukprot:POR1136..scf295_9